MSYRYQPEAMLPAELYFGDPAKPRSTGPLVIHANPPEFWAAQSDFSRRNLSHRMRIGAWVWELPVVPKTWVRSARCVDEIWVPSHFCAEALGSQECPVRVVPHPVLAGYDHIDHIQERTNSFDLQHGDLVFLAVCDLRSSIVRKNPIGVIEAFKLAFTDRVSTRDVQPILLLKIGGVYGNEAVFEELRKAAQHPNIRLITGVLPHAGMIELIAKCDVFVSLHRAEGFGLVIAQAMLAGKPTIMTDWSGPRDFVDASTAALVPAKETAVSDPQGIYPPIGHWAEPDTEAAIAWMRRLAAEPDLRRDLGERAAVKARSVLSADAWWRNVGADFRRACGVTDN